MNTPRKVALGLIVVGVALTGVWLDRSRPRPTRPLDAVPADAFVALEVNVEALRKSPALNGLFGDHYEQSLTKLCGFDPVDRMDDLVFTVPEGAEGTFGMAVQADLSQDELVRCSNEFAKGDSGYTTSDVSTDGPYTILTPRSTTADGKPARSLGYQSGSPILLGPKDWLHRMVVAIDGAADGRTSAGEHEALRTTLTNDVGPGTVFLFTGSMLLEKAAREKLKAEMIAEVGPGQDSGTAMMMGILGMSEGGLALFEKGAEVRALADLQCEEERQCAEVLRLITKVRGEWAALPALKAFGLATVIEHLEVEQHGTKLQLRAGAPTSDLVRWASLVMGSKQKPSGETAAGSGAAAEGTMPPGAGSAPVGTDGAVAPPTHTTHITVPDGIQPGQPFTVRIENPAAAAAAGQTSAVGVPIPNPKPGTRTVGITVPDPTPSAAPAPPR